MILKECNICKIKKELSNKNFQPSFDKRQNKFYFKNKCRECEKESCKQYHTKNRNNILDRKRRYDAEHVEKKSEYNKIYNQNIESKNKNAKRALKRYYLNKNNPIFILRQRIRNAISKQLKRIFTNKNGKSITKYLPYTMQILKDHLEKQFNSYMSWDNYGSYWHIDHIIPHSLFHYTSMEDDDFKECWVLSNLRPLEAKQNVIDGATRVRHKLGRNLNK